MRTFLKLAIPRRNNQLMDRDENDAFAVTDDPADAFNPCNAHNTAEGRIKTYII